MISPWLIALMAAGSAAVFYYRLRDAVKVLNRRAVQDTAGLVGQPARCVTDLRPYGTVHIDGENWMARCPEGSVKKGDTVKVIGLYGLSLVVEAVLPAQIEPPPSPKEKKDKKEAKEKKDRVKKEDS
jgi:membrane-bound ClpP family serine protease